jgi:hypothetical protein
MEGTHLKGKVSLSCFSNFITTSHLIVPVPGMDSSLSFSRLGVAMATQGTPQSFDWSWKTPLTATCKYLLGTLCNMLLME